MPFVVFDHDEQSDRAATMGDEIRYVNANLAYRRVCALFSAHNHIRVILSLIFARGVRLSADAFV